MSMMLCRMIMINSGTFLHPPHPTTLGHVGQAHPPPCPTRAGVPGSIDELIIIFKCIHYKTNNRIEPYLNVL